MFQLPEEVKEAYRRYREKQQTELSIVVVPSSRETIAAHSSLVESTTERT